ncbi:MAG TPA: hypothetical protein VG826_19240 [Pirellulales bacterium]|nr:hypothetical protein [Pirellulales bacterium]
MTTPSPLPRCPECGAAYRLGGGRCWLCGGRLPQHEGQGALPRPAPASRYGEIIEAALVSQETAATFSLSSLFLVMTLAAVSAGAFAAAPGLGIFFVVIAAPALIRTIVIGSRRKRLGVATSRGEKIFNFLQSIGVMILILVCIVVALGVALFAACTGALAGGVVSESIGKSTDAAMIGGAAAGGLIALVGIGTVLWAIWNKKRSRH